MNFFREIKDKITKLVAKKERENLLLTNIRLFDLIKFLRSDVITQLLNKKKFFSYARKSVRESASLRKNF
jgi:hypothetical protein